jgi:Fur family transcriptional regulator, ferric uptake regulator
MPQTSRKSALAEAMEGRGLRLTGQRQVIARVIEDADDHPDVEALHARAMALDPRISLATVYRTVKLFEESGLLERLDFGDGRARYEDAQRAHHDHLIDLETGEVIEFHDPEIERLKEAIAARLGYRLRGHRLELFGIRAKGETPSAKR